MILLLFAAALQPAPAPLTPQAALDRASEGWRGCVVPATGLGTRREDSDDIIIQRAFRICGDWEQAIRTAFAAVHPDAGPQAVDAMIDQLKQQTYPRLRAEVRRARRL